MILSLSFNHWNNKHYGHILISTSRQVDWFYFKMCCDCNSIVLCHFVLEKGKYCKMYKSFICCVWKVNVGSIWYSLIIFIIKVNDFCVHSVKRCSWKLFFFPCHTSSVIQAIIVFKGAFKTYSFFFLGH